jgi:hypothetical protein
VKIKWGGGGVKMFWNLCSVLISPNDLQFFKYLNKYVMALVLQYQDKTDQFGP